MIEILQPVVGIRVGRPTGVGGRAKTALRRHPGRV